MTSLIAGIGLLLIASGLLFQLVAAVGLVRFPDVYCRLHVVGINDALGSPLILIGAAVIVAPDLAAVKLLLGVFFLFLTSPLVSHLLAAAAMEAGCDPEGGNEGRRP